MASNTETIDGLETYKTTASSEWTNNSYLAYKAFTRSYLNKTTSSSEWNSASNTTLNEQWLKLELAQEEKLKMYDIWSSYYASNSDKDVGAKRVSSALSAWTIYGSKDDTNWEEIHQVNETESSKQFKKETKGPQKATFVVENNNESFRYYRLNVISKFSDWDDLYSTLAMVGDWVLYK
jgi:hypothetical protein